MADAAVATPAPSTGAAPTTGAESAASSTAGSTPLTDEQILGIGADEATADGSTQVAQPGAEQTGAGEQETQSQPNEDAAPSDQPARGGLSPEVREFFKTHPEMRDAFYRGQKLDQLFPDFRIAQTLSDYVERFGSPEALIDGLRGVGEVEAVDQMFYSGDPAQHGQMAENLLADSPENFRSMVGALPETLHRVAQDKSNPELAQAASEILLDLRTEALRETMLMAHQTATQEGNQDALDALDAVAEYLMGRAPWSPEEREAQLQRREQRYREAEQRRQQAQAENAGRWVSEANEQTVGQFVGAVRNTVDQLVGRTYGDDAKRMLTAEIYNRVSATLERDQELVDHVQALVNGGKGDPRVQQQLVRLVATRAKRLIPTVAEKVIGAFGAGTLARTTERQQREQQAASRTDVTGSAGMNTQSVKVPTPDDIKKSGRYRQLTDDDIIEGRV